MSALVSGDVIHVVPQRQSLDCGISAGAMLCAVGYEVFNEAVIAVTNGRGAKSGLTIKELQQAAKHLGFRLTRKRKYDIETAVGIVSVRGKNYWHFAVLAGGNKLIDPSNGTVWEVDAYLDSNCLKAHTLLVLDECDA